MTASAAVVSAALAGVVGFSVHRASLCNVIGVAELLSTAALLLGAANGVLFARFGSWTYTSTAGESLSHLLLGDPAPGPFRWVLFAALLGGVVVSSLIRGDFTADWRPRVGWLVNLMGGALMGVGAALVPGGNDALILHGIPGGSPHALAAYFALLVGAAAGLVVIKQAAGMAVQVECSGDICRLKKEGVR